MLLKTAEIIPMKPDLDNTAKGIQQSDYFSSRQLCFAVNLLLFEKILATSVLCISLILLSSLVIAKMGIFMGFKS